MMSQTNPLFFLLSELVSWRSAMDILLIAAGLYFLYHALLRQGAWKIVTGLLAAIAVFLIANLFDLRGIEWIYANVSQVAAIALIVIFQPELRKIFERASSLRRDEVGEEGQDLAKMAAESLFSLAAQRRGAILVFQGKEPLRGWMSGGQELNAEPSLPLILSLFDPHSPGHDGAVIFRSGRLTRFGVRLPMSRTTALGNDFGTRHHAALGLSEVSDALVMVVSEERGTVTACHGGQVEPMEDRNAVVESIRSHWRDTRTLPFRIRHGRWDVAALQPMVVSLVLALLFWATLIFAGGEIVERYIFVPVEYTTLQSDMALIGNKPSEVKLHVKGIKKDLDSLGPGLVSVKIDLSSARPGKQTFPITQDNVRLPKKIRFLGALPSGVTLTLSPTVVKEIPISPQLIGRLPKGVKLNSIRIIPEKVFVSLPGSMDSEKEKGVSLVTTPIYLDTIYENTRFFCKLIAPSTVQPVDKRWPDVEVHITVGREVKDRP